MNIIFNIYIAGSIVSAGYTLAAILISIYEDKVGVDCLYLALIFLLATFFALSWIGVIGFIITVHYIEQKKQMLGWDK